MLCTTAINTCNTIRTHTGSAEALSDNNVSHLNNILWRAIKRSQMPAVKEPINLMQDDNKRPDGTTLLPWARGKPMTWDVTVYQTHMLSPTLAAQQLNQVQQPAIQHMTRRISTITEDIRFLIQTFLFQRLSMALQRANAVSFHNTMVRE